MNYMIKMAVAILAMMLSTFVEGWLCQFGAPANIPLPASVGVIIAYALQFVGAVLAYMIVVEMSNYKTS
jgi:hypothetical protein